MRIRILAEGKTTNPHLRELESEYQDRIAHFSPLIVEKTAPARALAARTREGISAAEERLLERLEGSTKVFLDPRGREWSSEEFADWLGEQAVRGTRELAFVLGGRTGFAPAFRKRADLVLALSRMTLTGEWARVLLLEQIYRAFARLRGYPYSK